LRVKKENTQDVVLPGEREGSIAPGGRRGRESGQSRGKTGSDDLKLNRRVRQEEKHIVPAGVVQKSQCAGGGQVHGFGATLCEENLVIGKNPGKAAADAGVVVHD